MRQAKVFYKDMEAGLLTQLDDGAFVFRYSDTWMVDDGKPSISLTLPKSNKEYHSKNLFPFFFNMLPEGSNKQVLCHYNRIDSDDYFGQLLAVAKFDSIGAVRVLKIDNP